MVCAKATSMPLLGAGWKRKGLWIALLFCFGAITAAVPALSQMLPQTSDDGLWSRVSPDQAQSLKNSAPVGDGAKQGASNFQLYELNIASIKQLLARVPREDAAKSADRAEISVPLPDGKFQKFVLVETPLFEPELAAKFPEHKAYRGQSVDGPNADLALEISPKGIFAQVRTNNQTIVINPYPHAAQENLFTSSDKADFARGRREKRCLVEQQDQDSFQRDAAPAQLPRFGGALRTYRLAMAATGEYTRFHGGTVAGALTAIQTTVNRLNQVYEAEVSIRFRVVGLNDTIIFDDPKTDPFTNDDADVLIKESQSVIDRLIGSEKYDIGHTLSTGAGGLARIRSVAQPGEKAMGVTGSERPIGDPFDIDYVAHEIGHQFGANHTFNGVDKSCAGSNRNAATAYEPGSGLTILAYAGICGSDNIQKNSYAYFHFASLDEISRFVSTDPRHPPAVPTANEPPVARVTGGNFTIPKETPFQLTAQGSDVNRDQLSFVWEEEDLGPARAAGAPDNGRSPLFKSYPPVNEQELHRRVFPSLAHILDGKLPVGEHYPATNRRLQFRVTVRDQKFGGGAFAGGRIGLTVVANAGPFKLVGPAVGSTQAGYLTVTWDPARTDRTPINTKFVNIHLSTDGGQTFGHVLASNTPNDGSELVQLPANVSGTAMRLKVEAVDNVFFAISPANFTVEPFTKTFVVVRHAEPATSNVNDPGLSESGMARAKQLSELLFRYGELNAVFSTDLRRARETAEPSAAKLSQPRDDAGKIVASIYQTLPELGAKLDGLSHGSRVLIVGHSDTVGDILKTLGSPMVPASISENDHDDLFIVARSPSAIRAQHFRYTAAGRIFLVSQ